MEQEPITEKGGESVLACARCQGDIEHKTDDNGIVYWTQGHNGLPLVDGRVCDECNEVVIGMRLIQSVQYRFNNSLRRNHSRRLHE